MKKLTKKILLFVVILLSGILCSGCQYLTVKSNTTKESETTETTKDNNPTTKEIISTTLKEDDSTTTKEDITTTEEEPSTTEEEPTTTEEEPSTTEEESSTTKEESSTTEDIPSSKEDDGTTGTTKPTIHSDDGPTTTKPIESSSSDDINTSNNNEITYETGYIEDYSNGMTLCADGYVENVIYEDFQIHFIETGVYSTGESIYIKAGNTDILIDAGPSTSAISGITEYIDKFCLDKRLEYVITTHSHSDHWAGMYGSSSKTNGIMYTYEIGTIIQFAVTTKTNSGANTEYGKYLAAVEYARNNGANVYTAAECINEENGASSYYVLDQEKNMSMTILYNYYYFNKSSDENNHSVCTLISYGDKHFLLTGDLEEAGERKMAEYYDGSSPSKTLPNVELFKSGHHGSQTSSNECLLSKINPKISVVCCCAGTTEYTCNNDSIFPTQAFIDRIAKYTDRVYVNSMMKEKETCETGTFTFEAMNGTITISSNSEYVGIYATNNLIKLKDTDWFNETIYIDSSNFVASGTKGSKNYYTYYSKDYTQDGLTAIKRRVWPSS